jgi:hypothetical protein
VIFMIKVFQRQTFVFSGSTTSSLHWCMHGLDHVPGNAFGHFQRGGSRARAVHDPRRSEPVVQHVRRCVGIRREVVPLRIRLAEVLDVRSLQVVE